LGKSRILPISISVLSLTQAVFAIASGLLTFARTANGSFLHAPGGLAFMIIWLGGSSLCDIAITISMVTLLLRAKSASSFHRTQSVLSKLINLTIETCMATALAAILNIILYLVFSNNMIHIVVFSMVSKLYANSLIAALNARPPKRSFLESVEKSTHSFGIVFAHHDHVESTAG